MLFKCCLLHRDIVLPRNATFSMFLYVLFLLCVLFMWSICHYRFHFHYLCDLFAITVFIFITINRVISMTQANLFFGHVCQKLASGFCLAFVKKKKRASTEKYGWSNSLFRSWFSIAGGITPEFNVNASVLDYNNGSITQVTETRMSGWAALCW